MHVLQSDFLPDTTPEIQRPVTVYGHGANSVKKSQSFIRKEMCVKEKLIMLFLFLAVKIPQLFLLRLLEEKRKIDAVVYFNCGSFEWPQMEESIFTKLRKEQVLK